MNAALKRRDLEATRWITHGSIVGRGRSPARAHAGIFLDPWLEWSSGLRCVGAARRRSRLREACAVGSPVSRVPMVSSVWMIRAIVAIPPMAERIALASASQLMKTPARPSSASRVRPVARNVAESAFLAPSRVPRTSVSASRAIRQYVDRESTAAMRAVVSALLLARSAQMNSAHRVHPQARCVEPASADPASIAATKAAEFARHLAVAASSFFARCPIRAAFRADLPRARREKSAATRAAAFVPRLMACAS
jgi:hypothetical protein